MALVKYNNNSISAVTALDSVPSGDMVLLATNTITSGVASSSFTSNIDSTYNTYVFKLINMHPATNNSTIHFQGSTNGGSSYGVTITSTVFNAYHNEADTQTNLGYQTGEDLAQSTSYQMFQGNTGSDNDQAGSGYLYLFSPSSTTFVKHFIGGYSNSHEGDYAINPYIAGYFNTTSAIDAMDFKFHNGNIDSGVIKMYGLRES